MSGPGLTPSRHRLYPPSGALGDGGGRRRRPVLVSPSGGCSRSTGEGAGRSRGLEARRPRAGRIDHSAGAVGS